MNEVIFICCFAHSGNEKKKSPDFSSTNAKKAICKQQ
jgi:hypothetical protein